MVCLGDLALDIVVRAAADVDPGTDVAGEIRFRAGGSAANTARAFAAIGGRATFIGAVGDDSIAKRLTAALRAAHVTARVVRRSGMTTRLLVLIDAGGERSFITDRGVADELPLAAVKRSWTARLDVLHLPAYSLLRPPLSEAALDAAARAHAAGALVSVDLASRGPLLAEGAAMATAKLRAAAPDILFGNADEADALVGAGRGRRLLDLAPVVVIKEGSAGCRVLWRADPEWPAARDRGQAILEIDVATTPIPATDTTGAGDAFDAGFLHSLVSSDYGPATPRRAAVMRRAAVAGHRAAARLLTAPRTELVI